MNPQIKKPAGTGLVNTSNSSDSSSFLFFSIGHSDKAWAEEVEKSRKERRALARNAAKKNPKEKK